MLDHTAVGPNLLFLVGEKFRQIFFHNPECPELDIAFPIPVT